MIDWRKIKRNITINNIKKIYDKYWWCIFIIFILFVILWYIAMVTYSISVNTEDNLKGVLIFIICCMVLTNAYPLYLKKWRFLMTNMVALTVSLVIYFIAGYFAAYYDADKFTHGLEIPKNIELHNVNEKKQSQSLSEEELIIYKGSTVGEYNYQFYYKPTQIGQIYLKAYEITRSTPLSKGNLKYETIIDIVSRSSRVVLAGQPLTNFKINEGEEGHKYAVRFEVWFIPANGTAEIKLHEKNYMIEGWQRN